MGWFLFLCALVLIGLQAKKLQKAENVEKDLDRQTKILEQQRKTLMEELSALKTTVSGLTNENESLQVFRGIRDIAAESERITAAARADVDRLNREGFRIKADAERQAAEITKAAHALRAEAKGKADFVIAEANARAAKLISDAEKSAEQIAGDALRALRDAERLEQTAKAMKNVIEGYGDSYSWRMTLALRMPDKHLSQPGQRQSH